MEKTFPVTSGRRFASDLRRIRERKGVAIEDIYEQTRVRSELISIFEETALFEHELFNRVYLRALVRRYAEIVEIDPEVALSSLEEAMEGRYEGRLAQQYLGESLNENESRNERSRGSDRTKKPHRVRLRERAEDMLGEPVVQ